MLEKPRRFCTLLIVIIMSMIMLSIPAKAQVNTESQEAQWLEDFVHYVLIARLDLAHGSAQAILDSEMSNSELYLLVEDMDINERLTNAIGLAMRRPELEEVAGELQIRLNKGRVDVARDPAEIDKHINNLVGSARAQLLAQEALIAAGEYAVPQLLEVIVESPQRSLKAACRAMLVDIGRQAVTPLSIALPNLDPVSQEAVCQILGEIGYLHALPAIYQLSRDNNTTAKVVEVANKVYRKIGGMDDVTVAQLWINLAEAYWDESESLIAWPLEENNNIWSSTPNGELTPQYVPTDVFSEIMAMKCAEQALRVDYNSAAALSMWLAANFRRADQLLDRVDQTYASDMQAPLFYAVNAGPAMSQRILNRAYNDLNSSLARHAISVLADTAGGASLWLDGDEPSPLVKVLDFPDRRVRYEAAMALGQALPASPFDGSDRVVPILASSIRIGAERFAAVIADNEEDQRSLAASLRTRGFTVLPPRDSFDALQKDMITAVGVDLFILKLDSSQIMLTINAIRRHPLVAASPVMIMSSSDTAEATYAIYENDIRVGVVRSGVTEDQFTNVMNNLIRRSLGELMTDEEADQYASRALTILRDIALKNSRAYDVTKAESALIEVLDKFTGELRLTAAETLSWIATPGAQTALLDAALTEDDDFVQIALLGLVSDSAKRFGSFATDRQIRRLLSMVQSSTGILGTASAQTHGALNLPPSNTVPLILINDR